MAGLALRKRFTCFPRLPLEVRLLIWGAALPGPRLVSIRQRQIRKTILDYKEEKGHDWPPNQVPDMDEEGLSEEELERWEQAHMDLVALEPEADDEFEDDYSRFFLDMKMLALDSECPSPNIMLVCWEACGVVARSYTKAFAYPDTLPGAHINFTADVLYLRDDCFTNYSHYDGSASIIQGLNGDYAISDTDNLGRVRSLAVHVMEVYELHAGDLCGLLDIFTGAKELLVVARDYNIGSLCDYPPDSVGQGCFIDPIDPVTAIKAYSACRQRLLAGNFSEATLIKPFNVQLLSRTVEMAKQEWNANRKLALSREFINARIMNIVPRRLKRDLDQAKELYEQALGVYRINEDIRKREELHAAGFCTDDALSEDDF